MSNVTIQGKKASDRTKVEEIYSSNNNMKVVGGIGVIASDYSLGDLTITTQAISESITIPSGASMVWVCNESVTATQAVRIRFGASGDSATVTTGFRLSPGAAAATGPQSLSLPVPPAATHMHFISEVGTPTLNIVFGG